MSKKVYSVRILVETEEDVEVIESRVRGWGEATFEGFVLLDLTHVKTSLVDIDSLAHTLAKMIKSQENMQESLRQTIDAFNMTSTGIKQLINDYLQVQVKEPDEATTEETQDEVPN